MFHKTLPLGEVDNDEETSPERGSGTVVVVGVRTDKGTGDPTEDDKLKILFLADVGVCVIDVKGEGIFIGEELGDDVDAIIGVDVSVNVTTDAGVGAGGRMAPLDKVDNDNGT